MALRPDTAVGGRHSGPRHPLTPVPYRVVWRHRETSDVVTLALEPLDGPPLPFRCGQFNMLTVFGVGEVAVSMSSAPGPGPIEHTVRAVGAVTNALCAAEVGTVVGVRGAFGTDWGLDGLAGGGRGADIVVVAGGIGLAPLRGAVRTLTEEEGSARRTTVLVGARSPEQIVFGDDLRRWRAAGAHVSVTVDTGGSGWTGPVGVVTSLLRQAPFDPRRALALVCGPEVMMRFTARALADRGLDPERIRLSLERNMQCGVGLCGHCQLGPLLICRDGPVVAYSAALAGLLAERER